MNDILIALDKVLTERKLSDPDTSYVSGLYHKGLNKILEKVGEEATETLLAAKDVQGENGLDQVVYETADLWFHTLVMLHQLNLDSTAVLKELERRFDLSGLVEKENRPKQ